MAFGPVRRHRLLSLFVRRFQKFGRNFPQERRRVAGPGLAVFVPRHAMAQGERPHRPRHGNVKKPALFLQRAFDFGPRVGKRPSSSPTIQTCGNSSPLQLWTVMRVTASLGFSFSSSRPVSRLKSSRKSRKPPPVRRRHRAVWRSIRADSGCGCPPLPGFFRRAAVRPRSRFPPGILAPRAAARPPGGGAIYRAGARRTRRTLNGGACWG